MTIKTVVVLVRAYNAFKYFDKCIDSIFSQETNVSISINYIDDHSDLTKNEYTYIKKKLKNHHFYSNHVRLYSLESVYQFHHSIEFDENTIVVNLDGDDWFITPNAIQKIIDTYSKTDCELTYGNCTIFEPQNAKVHNKNVSELYKKINTRYPLEVEKNNSYRDHFFLPSHIRTWKPNSFKKIPKHYFLRPDKTFLRLCEDQAMMFPLLEMCNGNYQVISTPLAAYNRDNPQADRKIHYQARLHDELCIRKMKPLS